MAAKKKKYTKPEVKTERKSRSSKTKTEAQVASTSLVAPEAQAANQLTQTSAQLLGQVELFRVASPEDVEKASKMLVQLQTTVREVEARRKFFTGPLREHIKRIESLFKPVLERLEKADGLLREKLLAYQQDVARKQEEERARLLKEAAEAQESGDDESALVLASEASALQEPQRTTHVESGSVQMRKVWTFEVEDLGRVPMEYLSLDESKVRAAIRAGVRDIPGLRIFQKEQLAVSVSTEALA